MALAVLVPSMLKVGNTNIFGWPAPSQTSPFTISPDPSTLKRMNSPRELSVKSWADSPSITVTEDWRVQLLSSISSKFNFMFAAPDPFSVNFIFPFCTCLCPILVIREMFRSLALGRLFALFKSWQLLHWGDCSILGNDCNTDVSVCDGSIIATRTLFSRLCVETVC